MRTDANFVVQDVDAAVPSNARLDHPLACLLGSDVCLERDCRASLVLDHPYGLSGGLGVAIDNENTRPFASKQDCGRPGIADCVAWGLPGPDDDRRFAFKPHHEPLYSGSLADRRILMTCQQKSIEGGRWTLPAGRSILARLRRPPEILGEGSVAASAVTATAGGTHGVSTPAQRAA